MTYEELFFYMTERVMELEGVAGKLLVHLIGTAITEGTNELHATTRSLARDLRCWRNNVITAVEDLKPYIDVSVSQKTGYTFRLPADWFAEGRGIFTDFKSVEKSGTRSAVRTTTGPEDEPPSGRKAYHHRRTNGEDRTTGGAESGPERRTEGENRTSSGAGIGPLVTQNQQLTDRKNADPKDPDPLLQLQDYGSIQYIACSKSVTLEQRRDAMELMSAIRTYHREYAPANREDGPVPERILARCLAVAPLGELLSELKKMRLHHVRAGSSYGWYPAVFCQRFKGIHPKIWAAALEHFAKQARRSPQASLDFSTQMTAEIRQGMRRIS